MKFSAALDLVIEQSKAIRRATWPPETFVVVQPFLELPAFSSPGDGRKVGDRAARWIGADTPMVCMPYFAIYSRPVNIWQPGWTPSMNDCFADDWEEFSI